MSFFFFSSFDAKPRPRPLHLSLLTQKKKKLYLTPRAPSTLASLTGAILVSVTSSGSSR